MVALVFSSYNLLGPSQWLFEVMQLTKMSPWFKAWLMALALSGFTIAWIAERLFFPKLARFAAHIYQNRLPGHGKQRRRFKVLLEEVQK